MQKTLLLTAALTTVGAASADAQKTADSLKVQSLDEVVVRGVRASKDAPFAVANIKKEDLQDFSRTGKELPFLLQRTPGVVAWSENGMGTGTTYMRIRGAAGSRINVTMDGVALNSPEDQTVFWANMNSYASLLGSIQVQRGVGSSTNGDGAFGGSISLATAAPSLKPTGELTGSYGSYGTWNAGANFSTGLIGKHFIFDGAYHETNTDGYIDGTGGRSGSYYGGLTWLGDNFKLSYKNIGNFERTGQAWNGVLAGDYSSYHDLRNKVGIKTYEDLYNFGLGRWNSLTHTVEFNKNNNYSYELSPYTMRDGSIWDKTTDSFHQNHNILSGVWQPNEHWSHMLTLHYTYGYGYYNEFKKDNKYFKFGITDKGKDAKTDFVRKKGLTQHTYGIVYNTNWKKDNWNVLGGVNLQQFRGSHWGYLTYIKDVDMEQQYLANGDYKYYDSDAKKYDYSAFIKASYTFADYWNVFADVQYRHVTYKTDGNNDKFINGEKQQLDINKNFDFVNPKVGISYTRDGHKAYFSAAMSNREPERNNYTDQGSSDPLPKAERLYDFELGYQYDNGTVHAGVNIYYMKYDNQLVQSGKVSDIGEALTINVKNSYRVGLEMNVGYAPVSWFSFDLNAALSDNKIKNFTEYVIRTWKETDADHLTAVEHETSRLAFSPTTILNGFLDFHHKGFSATWHTNFVSKQYLDNTQNEDRSLPNYTQTDIALKYDLGFAKKCFLKNIIFGLDLNNIFNAHYAASGFVWYTHAVKGSGYTLDKQFSAISYIPMAGFTLMGHLTFKF